MVSAQTRKARGWSHRIAAVLVVLLGVLTVALSGCQHSLLSRTAVAKKSTPGAVEEAEAGATVKVCRT
jgi:hypothetical protein